MTTIRQLRHLPIEQIAEFLKQAQKDFYQANEKDRLHAQAIESLFLAEQAKLTLREIKKQRSESAKLRKKPGTWNTTYNRFYRHRVASDDSTLQARQEDAAPPPATPFQVEGEQIAAKRYHRTKRLTIAKKITVICRWRNRKSALRIAYDRAREQEKYTDARWRLVAEYLGYKDLEEVHKDFETVAKEIESQKAAIELPLKVTRKAKKMEEKQRVEDLRQRRKETDLKIQRIMSRLPAEATGLPPDWAWVYSHPAMVRNPSEDGIVEITEQDLKGAPSRGAASMLAHYANDRKSFYREVLAKLRSAKQDEEANRSKEEALDPDVDDLYDFLAEEPAEGSGNEEGIDDGTGETQGGG